MKSRVNLVMMVFLALFLAAGAFVTFYKARPPTLAEQCEAHGDWWDPRDQVCAIPVPLSTITGRKLGAPPAARAAPHQP
jgi:hypothetical protein